MTESWVFEDRKSGGLLSPYWLPGYIGKWVNKRAKKNEKGGCDRYSERPFLTSYASISLDGFIIKKH